MVTLTSTVPLPAGLVAVTRVSEPTVTAGALTVPNFTLTLPGAGAGTEKPLPVIVTMVPPTAIPLAGETPVTVGGEM